MGNKGTRLNYIDVAKGLLILGVVLIHMLLPFSEEEKAATSINIVRFIGYNTWVLFYMPAFFIISGICSNFNKEFKSFIISNIISLKAPVFFFIGILGALAIRPEYGFSPFNFKLWFVRLFESGVWFLHAMFLSRIYYWIINHYFLKSPVMQLVISAILYAIGFIGMYKGLYPMFWICHSLSLCVFLCVGNLMHVKYINKGWLLGILFIFVVLVLNIIDYPLPFIVQEPKCNNLYDSIIILTLSFTGTIGFLWICKLINKSPLLELLGRYSLIIYVLHSIFIDYFSRQIEFIDINNNILTLSELILELVCIVSLCLVIAYIFDRQYIRIIIGKKP